MEDAPLTAGEICGSSHAIIDGAQPFDYIGQFVEIVPDINGDNFDEVLVGAAYAGDATAGAVYLIDGAFIDAGGITTTAGVYAGTNARRRDPGPCGKRRPGPAGG